MERLLVTAVLTGGTIFLIAFIIWFYRHLEKKRTAALQQIADSMGLTFSAKQDDELMARLRELPLFNRGHGRKMRNVMTTESDNLRLNIFDYQFTTGGGQHSHTHRYSVVSFASASLQLPILSIQPEGFFAKLGAAMGMQDIDFDQHPEFSDQFRLTGEDEGAIRDFFDQELLDFFAPQNGLCLQCSPGFFIYFRKGRRDADQIRDFLDQAYSTYAALNDRFSRSDSTSH